MNDDLRGNDSRDQNRGRYQGRKTHKYGGNQNGAYSPSTSYNYSQSNHGRAQGEGNQQHPRRRNDRYRRESMNTSEKLVRQNESIIKLLREIRDRMPKPEETPPNREGAVTPGDRPSRHEGKSSYDAPQEAPAESEQEDVVEQIGNHLPADS